MSRPTGHLTVAMVALLVAWPSAAVGQSDWRTSTEVRELYEAARAEGEVVIWGAQRRELAWIQEPFGKRFPGIEVKWTADRSAATKLITEYRASRFAVDLFHFSLGGMLPVDRRRGGWDVDNPANEEQSLRRRYQEKSKVTVLHRERHPARIPHAPRPEVVRKRMAVGVRVVTGRLDQQAG